MVRIHELTKTSGAQISRSRTMAVLQFGDVVFV
jgi:hypothetical protein